MDTRSLSERLAGQGDANQQLTQSLQQLGRYTSGFAASAWHGQDIKETPLYVPPPGGFANFLQKAVSVGKQATGIVGGIGKAALGFVKHTVEDVVSSAYGTAKTIYDWQYQSKLLQATEKTRQELDVRRSQLTRDYRAGKINKENYQKMLKGITDSYQKINKTLEQEFRGPSTSERAQDVAETAANVLSLGSLGLARIGGKQVIETGSKEAVDALISQGATKLESLLMKSGAARSLITRNLSAVAEREGQQLVGESAWQFMSRNSRKLAADLLIKRPVFYESNIGQAKSLYQNLLEGDYKGALTDSAWLGIQMLDGGPLGAAKNIAGWTKSGVSKLAYGKGSFIDELSGRIGDGNKAQIAEFIAKSNDPKVEQVFRVLQDSNMRITRNNQISAVDNFMNTYANLDAERLTPKQIFEDAVRWREADETLQAAKTALVKSGKMTQDEADKLVVVRVDQRMRNAIAKRVAQAADNETAWQEVEALASMPNIGFGNNRNYMLKLEQVIKAADSPEEAAKAIRAIDAASTIPETTFGKKVASAIAERGYTVAMPEGGRASGFIDYDNTKKLVSAAIKDEGMFDPSAAPQPVVAAIAGTMERFGVSAEESNGLAAKKLSESVVASLSKTVAAQELGLKAAVDKHGLRETGVKEDLVNGGQAILSKLQRYIEDKPGVYGLSRISAGESALTDIRQMTVSEIRTALKSDGKMISPEAAKEIRAAIIKGYRDVPLEIRGLGDKAVDLLYSVNPMQKYYSRIQGALRYTYNPFFRVQESVETKILSHAKANNLIWMKSRGELDDAAKVLEQTGIFKGSIPGEAADGSVLGRITANLTQGQKRDLAGLAMDIANSQGRELTELAAENPEVLDDALRVVVQYPKKGPLSSSLAKTMNLVFFPMRYNAKVTGLAAEVLAKQPPSVQKAVLHSLFQFKDWLKSDEGITWQSKNADAIQLFKWVTPVNSIEATMKLFGGVNSAADLGQLGGLPFGLISQILDGQGIISLNTPYVDPKTGDVFPRNIPKTTKARAASAVVDVLNTMFTYPGRILGLPGKNQMLKDMVKSFIDTNGTDFEQRLETDKLTPLQENMIRVLKGDTSSEAIDNLYTTPAPGQFQGYTLPPYALPFRPEFSNAETYKAPKARSKKKKTIVPTEKRPL